MTMSSHNVKKLDTPGERLLSHQKGDFKTQAENKLSLEKLKTAGVCDKVSI